jgi:acyl-CoA synthetase (AMP-forming)/AMP-acid ligase II
MNTLNPLDAIQAHVPRLARISDYVEHYAAAQPEADAAECARRSLTWGALRDEVDCVAKSLLAVGVGHGDRVAMLAPPCSDFLVTFLAVASIGGVWLGLNPRYQPRELSYVLNDAAPSLIFGRAPGGVEAQRQVLEATAPVVWLKDDEAGASAWRAFLDRGSGIDDHALAQARAAVSPADAALLVYTSGSTGSPKGALLPHRGLVAAAARRADCWWHGRFRTLANLPINHIAGVGDLACTTLVTGGFQHFMEKFDGEACLEAITDRRLTFWYQIPTQLQMALAHYDASRHDLSCLQAVVWSGASAPADLIDKLNTLFPGRMATDYSLTESIGAVTMTPLGSSLEVLARSVGWPDPAREIRLSASGEILVRDGGVMLGYLNRPEATAEAVDDEGWLHTGDVARLLPDGTFAIVGRLREMYKSGGYNVYPREIEDVLESHPMVQLAAVVSAPHPLYGEVGHAYVTLRPGFEADEAQLESWCQEHLANYKKPKRIEVRASLPLLPVGKVDKSLLRRWSEGQS